MLAIYAIGILFFAIVIYCVAKNNTTTQGESRYSYVKETKRVWKGFERNPDNLFGISNVYENVEYYVLKEDPEGAYYNNGRKVR